MQKLELLTTPELAERLRVPVETVNRLTRSKKIPVIKLGHKTHRYNEDKVRAALDRLEVAAIA